MGSINCKALHCPLSLSSVMLINLSNIKIGKNRNAENWTQDDLVGSANATSVLCHTPILKCLVAHMWLKFGKLWISWTYNLMVTAGGVMVRWVEWKLEYGGLIPAFSKCLLYFSLRKYELGINWEPDTRNPRRNHYVVHWIRVQAGTICIKVL